ncbi:winged helix-turn-helix transcriptional regulator [Nocardia sp. NPDC059246]|uniref:winged helix-turn-helix transcriptional regulator n=1 Tax=unclassified Nocardia TaxID=2637762 RepID=UPI0036A00D73
MDEVEPMPDAVYQTSRAVGDAWSWLLMREALLHGVRRFADFQKNLGIARSTLSARLTQLMDGGLLTRGPEGSKAAGDYLPTPAGEDFFDCLMTAMAWGDRWYAHRETRPLLVTHLACGSEASPQLRCEACRKVLLAQDVRPERPELRLGVSRVPGHTHRAPDYELLERFRPCSIARTQTVLGDWWSCLVVREAFFDVHRFDEFRFNLDVATNILTSRLSRLVEHGVLRRTPYQTRPVRHEYHLTDKGLDLYPVALAIIGWGDRWKSPTGPLVPLTHLTCGQSLRAQLSCGTCGADLFRKDVDIAYPILKTVADRPTRQPRTGPQHDP